VRTASKTKLAVMLTPSLIPLNGNRPLCAM